MAARLSRAQLSKVYLAFKPVIAPLQLPIRKTDTITKILLQNSRLVDQFGDISKNTLIRAIQELGESRVFVSEFHARQEFPHLFPSSTSPDARFRDERAPKPEAKDFEEAASHDSGSHDRNATLKKAAPPSEKVAQPSPRSSPWYSFARHDEGEMRTPTPPPQGILLTLPPLSLPYKTQHSILTAVQKALEESCFAFVKENMPEMLGETSLDCAAALDLIRWLQLIRRQEKTATYIDPSSLASLQYGDKGNVLGDMTELRNAAVHRSRMTLDGVTKILDSALKLTQMLGDRPRAALLTGVRLELRRMMRPMELNRDTVVTKLLEIEQQRSALDLFRENLVKEAMDGETVDQVPAGQRLEEHVLETFGGKKPAAVRGADSASPAFGQHILNTTERKKPIASISRKERRAAIKDKTGADGVGPKEQHILNATEWNKPIPNISRTKRRAAITDKDGVGPRERDMIKSVDANDLPDMYTASELLAEHALEESTQDKRAAATYSTEKDDVDLGEGGLLEVAEDDLQAKPSAVQPWGEESEATHDDEADGADRWALIERAVEEDLQGEVGPQGEEGPRCEGYAGQPWGKDFEVSTTEERTGAAHSTQKHAGSTEEEHDFPGARAARRYRRNFHRVVSEASHEPWRVHRDGPHTSPWGDDARAGRTVEKAGSGFAFLPV